MYFEKSRRLLSINNFGRRREIIIFDFFWDLLAQKASVK